MSVTYSVSCYTFLKYLFIYLFHLSIIHLVSPLLCCLISLFRPTENYVLVWVEGHPLIDVFFCGLYESYDNRSGQYKHCVIPLRTAIVCCRVISNLGEEEVGLRCFLSFLFKIPVLCTFFSALAVYCMFSRASRLNNSWGVPTIVLEGTDNLFLRACNWKLQIQIAIYSANLWKRERKVKREREREREG